MPNKTQESSIFKTIFCSRKMATKPYRFIVCILLFIIVYIVYTQYSILATTHIDIALHKVEEEEISMFDNGIDMSSLDYDDPRLIKEIQRRFLIHPPPRGTPYFLKNPQIEDPSAGQSKVVLNLLNNMTKGFFIESGALDGEYLSNTLYMERRLGWHGLLVEPDPSFVNMIQKMQRHAWVAPVCLSPKKTCTFLPFNPEKVAGLGHIDASIKKNNMGKLYVQCIPIYSLLLALNQTTIDYFSLDVEGAEVDILNTIPFHLLDIKIFTIEQRPNNREDVMKIMTNNGYEKVAEVGPAPKVYAHDYVFVKKS